MEAATQPTIGCLQGASLTSQKANSMETTSAVEKSDSEPNNGHLLRPCPCPQEDRTPKCTLPQPPRVWGIQHQGPSVLESKVRALKEKMTASRQGASPCPATSKRPSSKKHKCRGVKVTGTPSSGSSGSETMGVLPAQSLNNRQLDSSIREEDLARNGDHRLPRPPDPGLECWNGRSLWPPEALWTLLDHDRGLLRENSIHMTPANHPGGPEPCNTIHTPHPRKGRPHARQDGRFMGGDLDGMPVTSEDFVPRSALLSGLCKTGVLEALGTGGYTLSLSDRVERNRLLLQEMLSSGGQAPLKLGNPAWAPSWDRVLPEQLVGDTDWDSGIHLQDLAQNRTFGPQLEPMLNPSHEEAKYLPQRARMKARTQPLRASHDIVPTITQGSRGNCRNPGLTSRRPFACRDSLQNGSTSDSSSGESGSWQWPRRGSSPSRVRFQDESARDAESRYLERLQQRPRPGLDQGLLCSKPNLAQYLPRGCRRLNEEALLRRVLPVPPAQGSQKKCRACGNCLNSPLPASGRAPPDWRGAPECQAAGGIERVQVESLNSWVLSNPLRLYPADRALRTEWLRETHTGDPSGHPEEVDSDLDSTDTSDSGRTDNEEVGKTKPSRARRGSPSRRASKPQGGPWSLRKTDKESPRSPHTLQHPQGFGLVKDLGELKEDQGHMPKGTMSSQEDSSSKPPVLESKQEAASQEQLEPGPRNSWTLSEDSQTPCKATSALTPAVSPEASRTGRQGQDRDKHSSLETISLPPSHTELPTPPQPSVSLSPEVWMPTPPSSRKTPSSMSHRKALLTRSRGLGEQKEPEDNPLPSCRNVVTRTWEPTPPQTQPRSPHIRHPLLALTTNNCNNSAPQVLLEPQGGAPLHNKVEKSLCIQEPECLLENHRNGGLQSIVDRGAGASEEPESNQEPEGDLQKTQSCSRQPVSSQVPCAEPCVPPAALSDRSKKISASSIASTLGLKKLFSALGQGTRLRVGKSRSYSVEHLQTPTPGTPKVKRTPSLQILHLVSPSHQHRKAASFQNLHTLLSSKVDRSSLYLIREPGDEQATGRLAEVQPRRSLSVEDVSAPSRARTVGRVVEVFPDGTSQLQLQRSPGGTFGFCVASGNGRRDSGFYVQAMTDRGTAKLYSGLLGVGDEILEVNGAKVARLGLVHVQELLAHADSLSLRVLRQRPGPR
ncbi:uncharacterized protein KIAA1614 homolog isoform X2 [Erinaceus europaeus]|uniref:Uncharacterized protein KIAA1614 homolog isoform X2 n=1 Tax=Erinaceus europaeus TaxID=9365 RepID=A0A1S3WEZ0_ERIEU|nr:uncharacterized protein KIAA1614 homolog isoform X2 [Erinaceus europaeus]